MDSWKQAPASAPLTGLQELLDWTPDTKPFQDLLRATVQLSQVRDCAVMLRKTQNLEHSCPLLFTKTKAVT